MSRFWLSYRGRPFGLRGLAVGISEITTAVVYVSSGFGDGAVDTGADCRPDWSRWRIWRRGRLW